MVEGVSYQKVSHIDSIFCWSIILSFFSECVQDEDCPNDGQNYQCDSNLCKCLPGHVLDSDACVGMLSNCYSYIT